VVGRRGELVREGVWKLWCEHAPVPTRLGYVILFVSDLDRAIGFYRDVIGVPLRLRADAYAEFATEGAKFALFPHSELPALIGREAPPDPAPWPQGEVAFFVDDVDAEHARLQQAGVPVLAPPTDRPWGERTLHVVDPDGNVVELTRAKQPA
jgi:lactoylglutathione lyase